MRIINLDEIKIDIIRTSKDTMKPHENEIIRCTHIPTGIYAESSVKQSQKENRDRALEKLSLMLNSEY